MTGEPQLDPARDLIDFWTPLLLRMVVAEGVVAAFGREERSPAEVAAITDSHAGTLERVIRALAGRGVFEERDGGRFRLTALGRRFLADEPGNIAGLANLKPWELHAWAEIGHTLRTGEPSFPSFFGQDYWGWLAANPLIAARFNDDMRRRTTSLLAAALPLYDWPDHGTVVDIGGGNGLLLERLLEREPSLRGVVFDLPHVAAEAAELVRAAGLADRVEVVGGDFFAEIPAGHDVYVLASILHDWDDDLAVQILERCHHAMQPSARLVLFEAVVTPGTEPDYAKLLDLHMLVLFGARERTRDEWERLLDRAGFVLERIVPTPGLAWIEARTRNSLL
jgi:SAM-dependent methyltransferase